jgi:hypothetical protein
MTYRLSTHVKPLIWVEAVVEPHSHSRIEYMIKVRTHTHTHTHLRTYRIVACGMTDAKPVGSVAGQEPVQVAIHRQQCRHRHPGALGCRLPQLQGQHRDCNVPARQGGPSRQLWEFSDLLGLFLHVLQSHQEEIKTGAAFEPAIL